MLGLCTFYLMIQQRSLGRMPMYFYGILIIDYCFFYEKTFLLLQKKNFGHILCILLLLGTVIGLSTYFYFSYQSVFLTVKIINLISELYSK